MQFLVTAGNTLAMIDRVRCITNVFSGRTGTSLALAAYDRGHSVTLLTSRPEVVKRVRGHEPLPIAPRWHSIAYRSFTDLERLMEEHLTSGGYDALVHCAAVGDYRPAGIFVAAEGTTFDASELSWRASQGEPHFVNRGAGKVKSDAPELWLRLVRAPKLVDQVRQPWGFKGVLVKFKLEVDVSDDSLLEIAEQSRLQSDADLMVANTLEGAVDWAYLGGAEGYKRISRQELPRRLLAAVEAQHRSAGHG
jgi:phosphopantothenate---cysteine ligase (CTP)